MTPRNRALAYVTAPLVIGLGIVLASAPIAQAASNKGKTVSEAAKESDGKTTAAKEKKATKAKESDSNSAKSKKKTAEGSDDVPSPKTKTVADKKTKDALTASKSKSGHASEVDNDKAPAAKSKNKIPGEKKSDSTSTAGRAAGKTKPVAESDNDTPKKTSSKAKSKAAEPDDSDSKNCGKPTSKAGKSKAASESTSKRRNDEHDEDSPKSGKSKTTVDTKKTASKTGEAPSRAIKSATPAPEKVAPPKPVAPPLAAAMVAPVQPTLNTAPVAYKFVAGQGAPLTATPVSTPLSAGDIELYRQAFDLINQGDYENAEAQLALVSDKSLVGYAEFQKLFSRGYDASYDELTGWLNVYGDHPMAMRVWNLAKRKKPEGTADPAFPLLNASATLPNSGAVRLNASTTLSGSTLTDTAIATAPSLDPTDNDLTPKSARSAYNNGQMDQAVQLGRKIGDHWVAGLALWRQHKYEDAEAEFKFVSTDPSRNAWSQASGAYWAGRCAAKMNRPDDAQTWFKIAASFPFTFYGLLAEARLGVTPAVQLAQKGLPPTFSHDQATALAASLGSDFAWAQTDIRARRLNALVQIGRNNDAKAELQAAIQTASNNDQRDQWLALAAKTRVPVTQLSTHDRLFDSTLYPLPDLKPRGGYTVDKALIFAFARKESKFNAKAYSYSGAYGLLQLMPGTAALVENDSSFAAKPKQLLNPATNLRVGQHYITRLQGSSIVGGDLLRTIAAYNAGPRPVKDAMDSLGKEQDSLLVMESIPVAQTRQYVEEVAANYWIYRQIMGKPSNTLALAASDARVIDLNADAPPPPTDDDEEDDDQAADTVAMATR